MTLPGRVLLLLASGAWALSAVLSTARTFTSSDGKRTFEGELVSFQSASGQVVVERSDGKTVRFQIDLLSEEDQAYVQSAQETLQIRIPLVQRLPISQGSGST